MKMDPRQLRVAEAVRLLNSTPLGEVVQPYLVYRHLNRAAYKIGDGKKIDLLRYAAWLFHARRETFEPGWTQGDYEAHKDAVNARSRAASESSRDIASEGWVHGPVDAARKDRCRNSFRSFCEAYFGSTFHLSWSADHLKVIGKIETAVLEGGLFAMAMPRGSGKALALNTPLPTPEGWTTMGDVQVGDWLFDETGQACRVTFATPVMRGRPCYRVTFSDGEEIICDAEHLWTVEDIYCRRNPITLDTATMAGRVRVGHRPDRIEHRYAIPLAKPLQIPGYDLPIPPYVLGLWLGNGDTCSSRITNHAADQEELEQHVRWSGEFLDRRPSGDQGLARCGVLTQTRSIPTCMVSMRRRLRTLGLLGNKHIPAIYLRGSASDRLELLQGLMDTDGSVNGHGHCEITLKANQLALDLRELLASLGIKFGVSEKWVMLEGRRMGPYHRFCFVAFDDLPVFRLARKRRHLPPPGARKLPARRRFITEIEPVPSVPVRCIQVDSPSHLYLAGRKMVPTHNTTLCETACLWALLYGHREFVALIGSDEEHAADMLDSIKSELENNDLLEEDFSEVCGPVRALEGIHQRAAGQLYRGARTHVGWTAKEIVLPTIEGSVASGAIIKVAGITGRIRGMKHKRADGKTLRPSLVLLDDPQTDESARSPSQCHTREQILAGAILGLAGPGRKIAGLMTLTVVRPDDMADRILDREKHPQWQGERTKMVYIFPANEKLWQQYAHLRAEGQRNDRGVGDAIEFYRVNQADMDAGAVIAWKERHNPDELSAIQHAMNLKLDQGEAAFFAEYQNEPLPEDSGASDMLAADVIAAKTNGMKRGEVPVGVNHLTMFIDVQGNLLFWMICGWEEDFTGYVLDYGEYPDQKRPYFTLRDAKKTLPIVHKGTGQEGAIYAGLETLARQQLSREWRRDDGAMMKIERCMIDANWGNSTDVVYQFCRQCGFAGTVMPSHGKYVGAASTPFSDYKPKRGDRVGLHWRIPALTGKRAVRYALIDTNYWKSFVHARLAVPMGDPGCLSLFVGTDHRLLSEHLTAENRVKTQGRGRELDEWKIRQPGLDNHWLDCAVGCAVAASMQGAVLFGTDTKQEARRPRLRLSELQGRRR